MKINYKIKRGFTLIETLIYVAIFSLFIGTLISFLNVMTTSRLNNQIVLEVSNQGDQIIRTIVRSIENADAINIPIISNTSSILSLATSDSLTNPTIFSLIGGIIYIKEGTGPQVALTNNNVTVNNLNFSNLALPSTSGSIQIRMTMTSIIKNSNNLVKTDNFYGSASIR
jgi:type II secretory pathway pseudopilin PulG